MGSGRRNRPTMGATALQCGSRKIASWKELKQVENRTIFWEAQIFLGQKRLSTLSVKLIDFERKTTVY